MIYPFSLGNKHAGISGMFFRSIPTYVSSLFWRSTTSSMLPNQLSALMLRLFFWIYLTNVTTDWLEFWNISLLWGWIISQALKRVISFVTRAPNVYDIFDRFFKTEKTPASKSKKCSMDTSVRTIIVVIVSYFFLSSRFVVWISINYKTQKRLKFHSTNISQWEVKGVKLEFLKYLYRFDVSLVFVQSNLL